MIGFYRTETHASIVTVNLVLCNKIYHLENKKLVSRTRRAKYATRGAIKIMIQCEKKNYLFIHSYTTYNSMKFFVRNVKVKLL